MTYLIFGAIAAYLIGSMPTSYIFAKLLKGIDIRQHGSGNVGATNLMRTVGKAPGVTALLLDGFKGVIAVTVIANFFYNHQGLFISEPLYKVMLGLLAVCGHVWTVFLKFKGGKGVATTIGVLLGLSWKAMAIGLLLWLIAALIWRYVSVASIIMAVSLPILMVVFNEPIEYVVLAVALCVVICYKHKPNIKRLINGTEYKIGQKIKK